MQDKKPTLTLVVMACFLVLAWTSRQALFGSETADFLEVPKLLKLLDEEFLQAAAVKLGQPSYELTEAKLTVSGTLTMEQNGQFKFIIPLSFKGSRKETSITTVKYTFHPSYSLAGAEPPGVAANLQAFPIAKTIVNLRKELQAGLEVTKLPPPDIELTIRFVIAKSVGGGFSLKFLFVGTGDAGVTRTDELTQELVLTLKPR
jgi:hypothetical protein